MNRILLLIKHQQNRCLLAQWLAEIYEVLSPDTEDDFTDRATELLDKPFDLCLVDFPIIRQLRPEITAIRTKSQPLFLPFVFLTTHENIGISTDHLEPLIDDIICIPIEKMELSGRLRVLLRSRSYSLELQAANQKLATALSQEQDLNQLKSQFVSMVSHEFRNPLNGISGMTQILERYGDNLTSEKKAEILQQLKHNISKMVDLLDNVLIISRQDVGKLKFKPEPLELETFCRGLIDEIQINLPQKQQINLIYRPEEIEFALDCNLLHHILSNLLSNACKYSPQNSTIDLEINYQSSKLFFIVRDRGIGIPAEDLSNLFDSFYRAQNVNGIQGSGLGLTIVKKYVELHQGEIAVESKINQGTTFTVILPTTSVEK